MGTYREETVSFFKQKNERPRKKRKGLTNIPIFVRAQHNPRGHDTYQRRITRTKEP